MTAASCFSPMPYSRNLLFYVVVALIALGLKAHYSAAEAEELFWILRPTALLVELVSGSRFSLVAGAGYVRADNQFIIAPACAGVNFMIAAFCMSAFRGIRKSRTILAGVSHIGLCLLLSYGLTLFVNTLRIDVSMELYRQNFQWGWMTPDRIHRLAGCVIFFTSLSCVYAGLERLAGRGRNRVSRTKPGTVQPYWRMAAGGVSPFAWYGVIVIGIPLLNQGWRKGFPFAEHCLTVFSVSLVVFLSFFLIKLTCSNKTDPGASQK